jgi:hypothetical protein
MPQSRNQSSSLGMGASLVLLSVERYRELLNAAAEVGAADRNADGDEARMDCDGRNQGGVPPNYAAET